MALSTSFPASPEEALPPDHFTQILKVCATLVLADTPALKLAHLTSLKLDLRAIQEVEAMKGCATDADFDELLFMPKVQDFLAQIHHDEQAIKSFWLLARMCYLALLEDSHRAQVIQSNHQVSCRPALLLAEFYNLPNLQERLRLLSRLAYRDFAAFIAETDQRALPLRAEGSVFLSSIPHDQQNSKAWHAMHGMFLAR